MGISFNTKGHSKYARMRVVPDVKGQTLKGLAEKVLAPDAVIHTDDLSSYHALSEKGSEVQGIKFDLKNNPDHLHTGCLRLSPTLKHLSRNLS